MEVSSRERVYRRKAANLGGIAMETIGQIFKRVREEKGLSIEQISKQTKMHHRVIEAIESDRFTELPAPAYVKGFIRRYASFLELDSEGLAKRYALEHPERPKQILMLNGIKLGTGRFNQYLLPLITVVVIVIVILIICLNLMKTMHSRRTSVIARRGIMTDAAHQPKVIVGSSAESEQVTSFEESAGSPEGKSELVRLKVSVGDDCWLQVKCDGKAVFSGILKKGTSEIWEALDNINIWTGKAEVMSLELNGRSLGKPGEGVIKNIIVTKQGFKVE